MQMFRELRRNKIQFHYLINWREGNVCWMEMKWTTTTNRHWSIKRPSTILENDCHKLIYGHLKTTFDWPRPVNGRTDNDLLRYFFSLLASAECLRLTALCFFFFFSFFYQSNFIICHGPELPSIQHLSYREKKTKRSKTKAKQEKKDKCFYRKRGVRWGAYF